MGTTDNYLIVMVILMSIDDLVNMLEERWRKEDQLNKFLIGVIMFFVVADLASSIGLI